MSTAHAIPERRRGRGILGWSKRVGLGLLIVLVAVPVLGAAYQAAATARDRGTFAPPGRLVAVGGSQHHISCVGEGSPTVLLESAFPGTSAHWGWVQPGVAAATRVCAYDRAGMGWSDAGPEPRDARSIATELHAVLEAAEIRGPYVLVGHSLGGLFVRAYADQYPAEVEGMVLVDATHPEVLMRLPPELAAGFTPGEQMLTLLPILSALGVTRSGLVDPFPADPDLPEPQRTQVAALSASTRSMGAIAGELRSIPASVAQVRAVKPLGDIPLVVLSAEDTYVYSEGDLKMRANGAWKVMQAELAALSPDSVQREVAGSTHESLVYRQRDASETVAAILQVVDAVRSGAPLVGTS